MIPPEWQPLTCVSGPSSRPFEVEPIKIGDLSVHIFDGEAIDLILQQLDTAPDFLAYLEGRAQALGTSGSYGFTEQDLLAASISNWAAGSGLSPGRSTRGQRSERWLGGISAQRPSGAECPAQQEKPDHR
jgi:hypothetical protein